MLKKETTVFQQLKQNPVALRCFSLHDCLPHRLEYKFAQSQTGKQEQKLSKTEGTTPASQNMSQGQTDLSVKADNVKIKGLQANVSIPKVRAVTSPNNERPPARAVLVLCSDSFAQRRLAHEIRLLFILVILLSVLNCFSLGVFPLPSSYIFILCELIQRSIH